MDEHYWREFRARSRKRTSMQMVFFVAPFGIFVAILKILEPMDYPAGDVRNSIEFRLAFYGAAIALAILFMVAASRWLRADRRKPE
jgi:hypothetical protein